MQKTVKKLDNNVVKALTQACEEAKVKVAGFEWLTHYARYDRFPGSLMIICVFDRPESLEVARQMQLDIYIRKLIQSKLLKGGIVLKDSRKHVFFDNEEDCLDHHGGNWDSRLAQYKLKA